MSLGGHTAAICVSICPSSAPCVPSFCWSNSAGVWTRGALSKRINWESLYQDIQSHAEYNTFSEELGEHGLDDWLTKYDEKSENLPEVTQMPFFDETNEHKAKNYMVKLANHFSHLGNYQPPNDPSLTTFITGDRDFFYGNERMTPVKNVWKGVNVSLQFDNGTRPFFLLKRLSGNRLVSF